MHDERLVLSIHLSQIRSDSDSQLINSRYNAERLDKYICYIYAEEADKGAEGNSQSQWQLIYTAGRAAGNCY